MKDLYLAVLSVGLGIFIYFNSMTFAVVSGGLAKNPALYPQILAVILILLGVALGVNVIRDKRLSEKIVVEQEALVNVAKLVFILCLYIVAIVQIGFPLSTVLFVYAAIVHLGGTKTTAAKLCIPVALALYVVFFVLFQMPMPTGSIWDRL